MVDLIDIFITIHWQNYNLINKWNKSKGSRGIKGIKGMTPQRKDNKMKVKDELSIAEKIKAESLSILASRFAHQRVDDFLRSL